MIYFLLKLSIKLFNFLDNLNSIIKRLTNLKVFPMECCLEFQDHMHLLLKTHFYTLNTTITLKKRF